MLKFARLLILPGLLALAIAAPAVVAPREAPAARAATPVVRDYYESEGDANSAAQGYIGIGDKAVVGFDAKKQKWYVDHWTP